MPAPANLVHQSSTSTGTGSLLLSSITGRQTFNEAFGAGGTDTFDYFIWNNEADEWEVGSGHLSDATTLVRDTIVASSNADSIVTFSNGLKFVTNDVPAAQQMRVEVYDPNAVNGDAFAMDNMVEGATTKIFTDTERTKLAGVESGATADQNAAEVSFDPTGLSHTDATDVQAALADHDAAITHFDTVADVEAASIPANFDAIRTGGYTNAGDGGAALYKRVASEPSHAGKIQSADGAWWEYAENVSNVRAFGAVGDAATDDAPAIQAAIDWARDQRNGGAVFIPPPPTREGGAKGRYRCRSRLNYYSHVTIFGGGSTNTELRFTDDTSGFVSGEGSDSITASPAIMDLSLRGNAPTSSVSSRTSGIHVESCREGFFSNISIQAFVDAIELDARVTNCHSNRFIAINQIDRFYPNALNDYPRFGVWMRGDVNKPQINNFYGCRFYAQISNREEIYVGDGSETDFDLDWTVSPTTIPLWKERGIRVRLRNAQGVWEQQDIGTDYDLYAVDDVGVETQIPPGTENVSTVSDRPSGFVDYEVRHVRVKLTSAPSNGQDVSVRWVDPTGQRGVRIDQGTGNSVIGGSIAGFDIGASFGDVNNRITPDYMQFCNTGFLFTTAARECIGYALERHNGTINDDLYSVNVDARRSTLVPGAARAPARAVKTASQSESAGTNASVSWESAAGAELSGRNLAFQAFEYVERDVDVLLDLEIENTGSGNCQADVVLERSLDEGSSWTVLERVSLRSSIGGASSTIARSPVSIKVVDTELVGREGGSLPLVFYRTQVTATANTAWQIRSGSLRVQEVNPA